MIKIDMKMPGTCCECPFDDNETGSCLASEGTGKHFFTFQHLSGLERWKASETSRDPRCPLREAEAPTDK